MTFGGGKIARSMDEGGGGPRDPSASYPDHTVPAAPLSWPPPAAEGHSGSASFPPPHDPSDAQLPAAAEPPKKKRGLGLLFLALFLVVAAGAGIAVYFFLFRREPALPMDIAMLPDDTQKIERTEITQHLAGRYGLAAADLPEEARWSYYAAALCGGTDVFAALADSTATFGRERAAEAFGDMDEVRKTLACGREISDVAGKRPARYGVKFDEGRADHEVSIYRLPLEELPATIKRMKSTKDPDNFEKTYCLKSKTPEDAPPPSDDDEGGSRKKKTKDKDEACERAVGKIEGEDLWVAGSIKALRAFGEELDVDGGNKMDDADLVDSVASDLSDADHMEVGTTDSAPEAARYFGGGLKKDDELVEALEDVKVWGRAASVEEGFTKLRVELHCDGEDEAEDLADALEDYLKEARRAMKDLDDSEKERSKRKDEVEEDDDEPKELRKIRDAEAKYQKARRATMRSALKDAKIEVSGEVVVLEIEEEPGDDDKEDWAALAELYQGRLESVAAIVSSLTDGQKPNKDELKKLGGPKLIDAVDPPEFEELGEPFLGLRIPGGGNCTSYGDANRKSCRYTKLTRADFMTKLTEAATADGWELKQRHESDDTFWNITKDGKTIELMSFGKPDEPARPSFETSRL